MIVSDAYVLDLLRQVVGLRVGYRCEYPGCGHIGVHFDPHHWFSRDNQSIRYDPDACLWLCAHDHTGGHLSAHRAPRVFRDLVISCGIRTPEWEAIITVRKNMIVKNNNIYREQWRDKLKAELETLKDDAKKNGSKPLSQNNYYPGHS